MADTWRKARPPAGLVRDREKAMTKARRPTPADWWRLSRQAVSAWSDDYAPSMGAALSYYSVFSMGPLLLIVVSVAGLVFGQEAVRGEIFGQLRAMMGDEGAKGVEALLAGVSKPEHGIVGVLVGAVALVVGATTVFGELQDSLDRIWRAPAHARATGLWELLRTRVLAFGMVLGVAFLLMVSLVLNAALAALGKWWGGVFSEWEVAGNVLNFLLGYAVTTVAFAAIYKWIPRVPVQWHDVWLGAAVTSALFNVGRFLIALYIGKTGLASGFGAAGSVAVIFVWVYYSAQIFLLGAEFTWVYATAFGSRRTAPVATAEALADPGVPNRIESGLALGGLPAAAAAPLPAAAGIPSPAPATSGGGMPVRDLMALLLAAGAVLLLRPHRRARRTRLGRAG